MLPQHLTLLLDAARAKYGRRADRVAAYLFQTDHLSDSLLDVFAERRRQSGQHGREDAEMFKKALDEGHAAVPQAPAALHEFFDHVEEVPLWLDRKLLELGGRTYLRCGPMPALVLGVGCLPLAYLSAVGNKPLAFTRKIIDMAERRLNKTGGFFLDVCTPGSLMPHGSAWKKAVEVRMQHAQMRRLLRQTTWKIEDWGQPINQLYLAGTGLLFSVMSLCYLRRLGFYFSAAESEGVMHLWRYVSYVLGIEPDLLCATETEGRNLVDMVLDLSGPADEDSLRLTRALMESALPELMEKALPWLKSTPKPGLGWVRRCLYGAAHGLARLVGLGRREGRIRFFYGLSQGLIGKHAHALQYQRTLWRLTAPTLIWSAIAPLELCRRLVPGATRLATAIGLAWSKSLIDKD